MAASNTQNIDAKGSQVPVINPTGPIHQHFGFNADDVVALVERLVNVMGDAPQTHEALIRNWPRLVDWLEDEREALRQRFLLVEAARQWQQQGRPADALWRGRLLDEGQAFDDLSELETEFLAASDVDASALVSDTLVILPYSELSKVAPSLELVHVGLNKPVVLSC
jgi:hypothetical protein